MDGNGEGRRSAGNGTGRRDASRGGALRRVFALAALSVLIPAAGARAVETAVLLDDLQHGAFDYFWNQANPANGLIKDRSTPGSPCSVASTGFGLSAICVGVDHGWVSRAAARARVLTTLNTFWNGPQGPATTGTIGYHGLFYHFLDMNTATRTWTSELSTIDTALLFAGIMDARQYFDTSDPDEITIRAVADSITQRADWTFVYNGIGIKMGWAPEGTSFGTWVGYNEAMILYVLALGSPTHPIPTFTWFTWTSGYQWLTYYGYTYINFPPLFGHQYSHCWIDFRSIQDIYTRGKGITYFENSRRATLAQREYCIANPGGWTGYGPNLWGLTASDDPSGYKAHGAPPAQDDNGTITPTAAASSLPFAPEVVIPTLHNMYDTYQAQLWGPYGFRDAFNPTVSWYGTDYLGIDQGPIILMIENYLTQSLWSRFMTHPDVQLGLSRAGFTAATSVGPLAGAVSTRLQLAQNAPNPFRGTASISFHLPSAGSASLGLYDLAGRRIRVLTEGARPAGTHRVTLDGRGLPSGTYFYRLETAEGVLGRKCTVLD